MTHLSVAGGFNRTTSAFLKHSVCTEAVPRKRKTLISVENRDYHDTDVRSGRNVYIWYLE